jgi:hypothetical protein
LTADVNQTVSYNRNCAFLEALFEKTRETIRTDLSDIDEDETPSAFRKKMTDGQTFTETNPFRKKFYDDIVEQAKTILAQVCT